MANAVEVIGDKLVRGSSRHLLDAHLSYVKPNQEECARKYRALAAVPIDSPKKDNLTQDTNKCDGKKDINRPLLQLLSNNNAQQNCFCTGIVIPVLQHVHPIQQQQYQQKLQLQQIQQQQLQQMQLQIFWFNSPWRKIINSNSCIFNSQLEKIFNNNKF